MSDVRQPRVGDNATLVEEQAGEGQRSVRLRLLVSGPDLLFSHPLPAEGQVVIGRGDQADVRIEYPAISRSHAQLSLGAVVEVEDLGSANGTKVRGQLLHKGERAKVEPGEVIELGSVALILQRVALGGAATRSRRLWSHDYFEARLEEECARTEGSRSSFGVIRIALLGAAAPSTLQEVLAKELRGADVIASYAPGEYELLVTDTPPPKLEALAQRLTEEMKDRGAPVRVGLACHPRDGLGPDALMARACEALIDEPAPKASAEALVVHDAQMQRLHELARRVAGSTLSVILMGETGVDKEVFAETIHKSSPRADKPFLRLNCAALSESLLESELFGHEKGAFTGAVKAKAGLLESANGGTVMLDEVGELPMSIQVKLLRVLEQREVMRVGELRPRPIDVRFVSATNRDLEAEVERGNFRKDLFFRLHGVSLIVPPLRERVAEIEPLARTFIAKMSAQTGRRPEPTLSPEAVDALRRYRWPGNIRELRNVIERAVVLCPDPVIGPEHLPLEKMTQPFLESEGTAPQLGSGARASPTQEVPLRRPAVDEADGERRRIMEALEKSAGNQTTAARLLGISRRTLLNRLDAYAIPRPRKAVSPR